MLQIIAMEKEPLNGLREVHLRGDASNRLSYPVSLILRQCCKLWEMLGTDSEFERVGTRWKSLLLKYLMMMMTLSWCIMQINPSMQTQDLRLRLGPAD